MRVEETGFAAVDGSPLAGTLCLPPGEGPHPAALLLVGSGEVDRDSDHQKLRTGVTRMLAEGLEGVGVGSLRYDKRGVGASGGSFLEASFADTRDDAARALEALRAQPGVDGDRVVVIGHSEGALHALSLAAEDRGLAGVCLLAGPAVTGEAALRWQAVRIIATLPAPVRLLLRVLRHSPERAQAKLFAKLRASDVPVLRIQGRRSNAGWLRGFIDHDPAEEFRRLQVPLLAVTGDLDLQVDPADLERMAALVPHEHVETHRVARVNHLLRHTDGTGSPTEYRKQLRRQQPLDTRVLETVTDWVAARVASGDVRSGHGTAGEVASGP